MMKIALAMEDCLGVAPCLPGNLLLALGSSTLLELG